jgi:hypothetical protein
MVERQEQQHCKATLPKQGNLTSYVGRLKFIAVLQNYNDASHTTSKILVTVTCDVLKL